MTRDGAHPDVNSWTLTLSRLFALREPESVRSRCEAWDLARAGEAVPVRASEKPPDERRGAEDAIQEVEDGPSDIVASRS